MRGLNGGRLYLTLAALMGLGVITSLGAEDKPVVKSDGTSRLGFAVEPKPLSAEVKKGLEYLVKNQQADGGWGQGGGWRTNLQGNGGRVEGEQVEDPSDVGNTCIALLALIRAGNTPAEGAYATNVARGLSFVMTKVEQADEKSLDVTDIKGTQLQSKIGPYIDTFLTAMVLAELKGKAGEKRLESRLMAAANKTIGKMERHQQKDGTFAGNTGWATVLSQGVANKAFNFAAQNGFEVKEDSIRRVEEQVAQNFDAEAGKFRSAPTGGLDSPARASAMPAAPAGFGGGGTAGVAAAVSDAGVALYSASSNLTNSTDVLRSYRVKQEKAREILRKPDATDEERTQAERDIKDADRAEKLNEAATGAVLKQVQQPGFVEGFGSNGGEEFLSFMNISETLLLKGGDEWKKWDERMTQSINRAQNGDGSWSGHHCITGKTFCTAAALLVLMSDRTPFPVEALKEVREAAPEPKE